MPLQVCLMEEDDIPPFAAVDDAAMKNWGLAIAMQKSNTTGQSRIEMIEEWMRKGFTQDSSNVYLKVIDSETNDMVAAAMWKFQFQVEEEAVSVSAEVNGEAVKKPEKSDLVAKPTITAAMGTIWSEFKSKYVGTKPHAVLAVLVTHPDHQRRGAGAMLVQWGCEKADEHGVMSILQASEAGLGLYLKSGFEVVQVRELDLRPYGVDETELRRGMVRQPKT